MESKNINTLSELLKNEDILFPVEIRIGPFKLMNEIGKGKFATVFLGIHEETGQKVSIKQLKKSELNTDNLLIKEINIQKKLFHPYLTQMYCVIEKSDDIYIISEYCSKGDIIKNLLEKGTFDESFSCKIFQQIISSLEYLHKNNICHRDIKPENILLTEKLDAKLTDFGLSRYFKKNELLNSSCGSPIYAAPEMLEGKSYDGTKIDIWSLGISLYTMVCGELPFVVDDENDIYILMDKIIKGNYNIPEFLSDECKDLIKNMLVTDPDKRITLEQIKNHKWVNKFNFNYMKSPGINIDECFLPIDIYLIKDICGKNEIKIRELVGDILDNKHNENTIGYYLKNEIRISQGNKSIGDLRPDSEAFLNYINSEKSQKKFWENDIKRVEKYYLEQILDLFNIPNEIQNKKDEIELNNNKLVQKNNLEILNLYIGPLIFIHDIIDEIINKVISLKNKKIKLNNYSVSSTSIMEIRNKKNKLLNIKISKENNLDIKRISSKEINQKSLSINKVNNIELISINNSDIKRSSTVDENNSNKTNIKIIDLGKKRKKNKSEIKNLQINLIENEIIINDFNKLGLIKNNSQNNPLEEIKNCFIKVDSNNIILKQKRKDNKKSYSQINNKSVDFNQKKIVFANSEQKNREDREAKQNILLSNYKRFKNKENYINTFIKTSFNNGLKDNSNSIYSINTPKTNNNKNINKFLNNNLSYKKYEIIHKNNYFPLDNNKNKKIMLDKYNNLSQKDIHNKKETNKIKIASLIPSKTNKKDELKINIQENKNMKNRKDESQIIKTKLSLDIIRQTIKKFVGNNVVENNLQGNYKFICRTKIGKDDLVFYLELISFNFETRIFKGSLIQGETKLYKELLLKIKEKLI